MIYPLIFNPKAKSQRSQRTQRFFQEYSSRLEVYPTKHGDEAKELAAKLAADGAEFVIAAGGDGTLNSVASGLAGTNTALGVIPSGTMNVFAREMGIPCQDFSECFRIIERGQVTEIDLFEANGSPFLQMAGVGLDAMVIEQTTWQSKKRLGPLAYFLSAVKILGEKPPVLEVNFADGRREQGVLVLAGNGGLYGGPIKLFRAANNRDSKLDVLVFREAGYKLLLSSLQGIAKGGIDLASSIGYFQTEAFSITAGTDFPAEIDGEFFGRFSRIDFVRSPRHLKVVTC